MAYWSLTGYRRCRAPYQLRNDSEDEVESTDLDVTDDAEVQSKRWTFNNSSTKVPADI